MVVVLAFMARRSSSVILIRWWKAPGREDAGLAVDVVQASHYQALIGRDEMCLLLTRNEQQRNVCSDSRLDCFQIHLGVGISDRVTIEMANYKSTVDHNGKA